MSALRERFEAVRGGFGVHTDNNTAQLAQNIVDGKSDVVFAGVETGLSISDQINNLGASYGFGTGSISIDDDGQVSIDANQIIEGLSVPYALKQLDVAVNPFAQEFLLEANVKASVQGRIKIVGVDPSELADGTPDIETVVNTTISLETVSDPDNPLAVDVSLGIFGTDFETPNLERVSFSTETVLDSFDFSGQSGASTGFTSGFTGLSQVGGGNDGFGLSEQHTPSTSQPAAYDRDEDRQTMMSKDNIATTEVEIKGAMAAEIEANVDVTHVIRVPKDQLEAYQRYFAANEEGLNETAYSLEAGFSASGYNSGSENAQENGMQTAVNLDYIKFDTGQALRVAAVSDDLIEEHRQMAGYAALLRGQGEFAFGTLNKEDVLALSTEEQAAVLNEISGKIGRDYNEANWLNITRTMEQGSELAQEVVDATKDAEAGSVEEVVGVHAQAAADALKTADAAIGRQDGSENVMAFNLAVGWDGDAPMQLPPGVEAAHSILSQLDGEGVVREDIVEEQEGEQDQGQDQDQREKSYGELTREERGYIQAGGNAVYNAGLDVDGIHGQHTAGFLASNFGPGWEDIPPADLLAAMRHEMEAHPDHFAAKLAKNIDSQDPSIIKENAVIMSALGYLEHDPATGAPDIDNYESAVKEFKQDNDMSPAGPQQIAAAHPQQNPPRPQVQQAGIGLS